MVRTLFTSKGTPVQKGRQLGKGGEGAVYEVPALSGRLAKLYHKPLDAKKQAKLTFMASIADTQLFNNYVAWPQETLHSSVGGPVIGFLMPKAPGKDPIHMVYSPAHRRQEYPKAAWDFLLYVARNVAASFETVHAHGHIIGDVNHGNFMVAHDSKVVIIDSDSFQINERGSLHLCEVGVPHFTPPELQSLPSFRGFARTTNHDNFGLALLIFHLLFGARHPYSGVPLRNDVGDSLEADIKNFRYAYAKDNQARGNIPPPRSIPVSILPDSVQSMFYQAFTEQGATGARPTAKQWVVALDALRGSLRKCATSPVHVYPSHLASCPWCALDQQGVVYFVNVGTVFVPTANSFVLAHVWGLIQAVPAPQPLQTPSPSSFNVTGRPFVSATTNMGIFNFSRLIVIAVALVIFFAAPNAWFVALLVGWAGWVMTGNSDSSEREVELAVRRHTLYVAQKEYDHIFQQAQSEVGPKKFNICRLKFTQMKETLEKLPHAEKQEIERLKSSAHDTQKQKFLDTFFIDKASIHGVGPARKAALRSFGIETAADVEKHHVMQVRGFGESLTRAVLDWKASCARQFKFNPALGLSPSDQSAIRQKFATQRIPLEKELIAAPSTLQKMHQQASARLAAIAPSLEASAKNLAQAKADLASL